MTKNKSSYYDKSPLAKLKNRIFGGTEPIEDNLPDKTILEYLETSYPSNHNYVLNQGKLIPLRQLARRYRAISAQYPENMDSLLDTSCSKGYFNFDAVHSYGCSRSMGIDVVVEELQASAEVQKYLGDNVVVLERIRLHELAERIDEFGGPFDVVLVVNCYQYLYFGSTRYKGAYMSHDKIFANLRKVCKNRVIFSNRLDVDRLQQYPARMAASKEMIEAYDEPSAIEAASRYFIVNQAGKLGRYPLWTLDVKP